VKSLAEPEAWDESAAVAAARALRADVAVFGEVRRTGGDLTIQGRWVEVRGDKVERGQIDPVTVPEGTLLEKLRGIPIAYTKAMKGLVTEPEAARMQKWAAPTTSPKAWEGCVR